MQQTGFGTKKPSQFLKKKPDLNPDHKSDDCHSKYVRRRKYANTVNNSDHLLVHMFHLLLNKSKNLLLPHFGTETE